MHRTRKRKIRPLWTVTLMCGLRGGRRRRSSVSRRRFECGGNSRLRCQDSLSWGSWIDKKDFATWLTQNMGVKCGSVWQRIDHSSNLSTAISLDGGAKGGGSRVQMLTPRSRDTTRRGMVVHAATSCPREESKHGQLTTTLTGIRSGDR